MKKICFITTIHTTMQDFLLPLASYLHSNTDWQIHIICSPNEDFEAKLPDYIHYHPIVMKRGISLGGISALQQMTKLFKQEKFDLIQYCTPNAAFYASIAGKRARIPVRLYCQWGMVYVSMKGIKRRIFKSIEHQICHLSTHIQPDSFGNLRFGSEEKLYPAEKGSVVWNGSTGGIDLGTFDISQKQLWRQEIRQQYHIPEDTFVFGFVGRVTGDKGINELLTAYAQVRKNLPNTKLLLVGRTEKEASLDPKLLQWAKEQSDIIFAGPQTGIQRYYAAMDVFVLPSYREGFGSVVIEAEAMELPVIATNIPGPNEAMKDGHSGLLIPKKDAAALAQTMEQLCAQRELCRNLGANGRVYVAERYEQQAFYRHILQNRQTLLDEAHRPKRICFVTTIHTTLDSFVVKLAEYLHDHCDYDITFICNPNEKFQASLPDYIHFHPIPMERGISLRGLMAMLKMRKIFHKEKFDLVQYSTPNASLYASLAGWLARIPVRLYCQWGIAYVGFSGFKRKIFKTIEKTVCRLSTWVEPDSFGNLNFSHAEGLYPPEKGSVNWNGSASGVDLRKFDRSYKDLWRQEKRRELGIPQDDFVYCFVGRINGDKGINELLTASRKLLEQNPKLWLILVGNPEKSASVDSSLYEWAQCCDHVLFTGYTHVVEQYLAAADAYVLPSYREGFGSAVIEAEAMVLPVIVTDIPGPTDAMLRNETGLVVPKKDSEALGTAMNTLAEDSALCTRFGEAGFRFASENFEQNELFRRILIDRKNLLNDR